MLSPQQRAVVAAATPPMGMPGPEPRPTGPTAQKMHPAPARPGRQPEQPQQCGKARCPQTGPAPCTAPNNSQCQGPALLASRKLEPAQPPRRASPKAPAPAPTPPAPRPAAGTCRRSPAAQCLPRRAPAAPAPEPPRPPRRAPQPAPRSRVNREPREEDPGLEMISRRPPKQKFANFEEYMAAHGGATAPIAGEGPLPELVPEFHLLSVPAENLVPAEDDE
mgnify:CR=1 FL=1